MGIQLFDGEGVLEERDDTCNLQAVEFKVSATGTFIPPPEPVEDEEETGEEQSESQ